VLLTRSPLHTPPERDAVARLACVKHAASVRPEPGSNSPTKNQSEKQTPATKNVTKAKPQHPNHNSQSATAKTLWHWHKSSTLLSSQTTNTHHQPTHRHNNTTGQHPGQLVQLISPVLSSQVGFAGFVPITRARPPAGFPVGDRLASGRTSAAAR
jgi:hypothetical protein